MALALRPSMTPPGPARAVEHWHYRYKLAFLRSLTDRARQWVVDQPRLLVAGDINVAPTDNDVFHPHAFVGSTHVSRAERQAFEELLAAGFERGTDPASDHAALIADFRRAD